MVHLKNRSLFTALYRRNWDLREEMDLLLHCLDQMEQGKEQGFYSDYHLREPIVVGCWRICKRY